MIPINKEELIQQYISYEVDSYKVNFKDVDKLDRVEKILNCHGWLSEAERAFKPIEEELKKKREILKEKIVEVFKNYKTDTFFELEEKIKPIEKEIRDIDRRSLIIYHFTVKVEELTSIVNVGKFFTFERVLIFASVG